MGAALIVIALSSLHALNVVKSESARGAKDIGIEVTSKKKIPSQKETQLYKERQQSLKKTLAAYFQKAIKNGDIVGAGVSVVQGDSIVISGGYGKRMAGKKAIVDGETVFRLGSLSKGFAGVLAASFQAEGKFDWNDKVTDYIPEFRLGDTKNTAKIRIAHILSHSSGTPYHSYTNLVEAGLPVATIAQRFNEVTPQSEPGQQYSYQNAMFSLCQEVILKATGEEVKSSLQNRFFTPLGMKNISMDHNSLLKEKNVALPHSRSRKGWRSLPLKNRYYNAVTAGGINASSLDMAKWMRFLLGHNPDVLPVTTIEKAFEPFIEIDHNNKYYQRWTNHKQSYYGFGWRIHEFQAMDTSKIETVWHHGGSVNNYRNEIAIFPNKDLGICVLLNGNSKIARNVIPDLYEIVSNDFSE